MSVWLNVISYKECKRRLTAKNHDRFLHKNNICTWNEGKDTCSGDLMKFSFIKLRFSFGPGDSGGPLLKAFGSGLVIVGITSFGPDVCADIVEPAVFVDVTKHLDWIKSVIRDKVDENVKNETFELHVNNTKQIFRNDDTDFKGNTDENKVNKCLLLSFLLLYHCYCCGIIKV